eukprot:TRINITY_DN7937_c0_g1_i1.p1 TRINITY_DN7937_c0_g1~~TRINITY_DN7937_c0_g1_i1.p1  ORF type:complete len:513 (-),score=109.02 TRINITY_DN7937_c0_g1_i1:716-2227(-)
MEVLHTERCKKLLEQFKGMKNEAPTADLWKWMLWCAEIPRGSGHTEKMRAALLEVAKKLELEANVDEALNVKIVKPATAGYENAPTVCLQAHQDIVNAHDPAIRPTYDPLNDPVWPYIEDGWLYAQGTSLGADDGMGIATAMYILERKDLAHPKLEFLCTADEETTTSGAEGLKGDFLCPKTKYIVNLDSEDKEALCLGSAGGGDCTISIPIKREALAGTTLKVVVTGLSGGHSGSDIQLSKANAFKIVARLLLSAWETGFVLQDMTGGSAPNAIPRAATATVVLPSANVEKFKSVVEEAGKMIALEYITQEPHGLGLTVTACDTPALPPATRACTKTILNFWKLAPSHPLRMSSEMSGMVETSCATTLFHMYPDRAEALSHARTSRDSQWHELEQYMHALADLAGGSLTITGKYPGWLPQPKSSLSLAAQSAHEVVFSKPCRVYAVHAGLECGIFLMKLPHCEAISIGPQVENPHSPSERCLISSGSELLKWVVAILKNLKQ